MKRLIISLMAFVSVILAANADALGTWKAYPAYYDITEIAPAGDDIFVLSSTDLFSYNVKDNSVTTYDKAKNLSDCEITHIAWNSSAKKLLIAYSNSNMDIMNAAGNVENISDLYNKSMTSAKTINSILINGIYAYVSTAFGILKVNVSDAEISDTYTLGVNVKYTALKGNNIYALCSDGKIMTASLSANLLDKSNWTYTSDTSLSSLFDTSDKTMVYDSTNKCYWTKDSNGKLISEKKNDDGTYTATSTGVKPDGPKYNYFGFLRFENNLLYSCNGETGYFQPATIQILNGDEWTVYQDDSISSKTKLSYTDISSIDYDPKDITHVFAGSRNGLYEFNNGKFTKFYNNENSPIEPFDGKSTEYELVTSVKFDKEGNLWCFNSQAPTQAMIELKTDGTWSSHYKSELMKLTYSVFINHSLGNLQNAFIDSRNLMWFVNNNYYVPSFYYYNTSTDSIKAYTTFLNQNGKTIAVKGVECIAEDVEGNIWIGTDLGPAELTVSTIKNGGETLTQPLIPRNDGTSYADYLLSGVDITSIAIDGGGRKWFGSNGNGVYLISKDNLTQIKHFTSDNSPLLSNNVESITINNNTGEVFFGTEKGLCSYMSDATASSDDMNKDNVYAYPNPVDPDYTGLISIVGLSYQANVKIVTSSGTLVAEGTSNGGMFTWDGKDKNGDRVASGIYFVETAKSDGSKGTVCKIAMIK